MSEAIAVAVITGVITLIGNIIALMSSSKKTQQNVNTQLAVMETQMKELTREVREHNNFASRIPVIEAKVEALEKKVS